jgi:prepilin-type N-terminal cleavage/methylation domain-containing protein
MTTITRSLTKSDPNRRERFRGCRGFTLAEIIIATGVSAILMAGVLSSFLMMGRSGANAYNYVGMESEARTALEYFAEDVRMTNSVNWASATDITLNVIRSTGANSTTNTNAIRYYYDSVTSSPTYKCFIRVGANRVTGVSETKVLIHNVESDFSFVRWTNGISTSATGNSNTAMLQIRLTIKVATVTAVAATNLVVSARYILRNK